MLVTPLRAYSSSSAAISALVWPTQVRWAIVGKGYSAFMATTRSRVVSRVLPNAP
jgi:hypothetical protein